MAKREIISVQSVCGKIELDANCAGCGEYGAPVHSGLEINKSGVVSYIEAPFSIYRIGDVFTLRGVDGKINTIDFDRVIGHSTIQSFVNVLAEAQGCAGGGGPYLVDVDTPSAGNTTVTDSDGFTFVIPPPSVGIASALEDADGALSPRVRYSAAIVVKGTVTGEYFLMGDLA